MPDSQKENSRQEALELTHERFALEAERQRDERARKTIEDELKRLKRERIEQELRIQEKEKELEIVGHRIEERDKAIAAIKKKENRRH